MMRSLSGRLFAAMAVLVLATALIGGGLAFRWSYEEAIELQDSSLVQVGRFAVGAASGVGSMVDHIDREDYMTVETPGVVSDHDVRTRRLPPIPAHLANGLQTIQRGSETWRVLVRTRADGTRIAIAQPTAGRDEIARGSALHTIAPLIVLVPCLVLLLGFVIRVSLRPVTRLAGDLDAKQSGHLQTLPADGMPTELIPFVASINRLLERLAAMFEHERRFIAAAAHELRSPVTALSLQAENLGSGELPDASRQRLDVLADGIRRIARLLEQLLTASRYNANEPARPTLVEVDTIAKNVVAEFAPRADARAVDLGFARMEPVKAAIEETALTVLMRNLIENALRYTPPNGRIDVSAFEDGAHARLEVEDSGPGVPAHEIDSVFEPFVRGSRPEGEGSGLGLTIVRSIVDSAGGTIRLENVERANRTGLRATVILLSGNASIER